MWTIFILTLLFIDFSANDDKEWKRIRLLIYYPMMYLTKDKSTYLLMLLGFCLIDDC